MFPGPTLRAAVTGAIESAVNRALELDPAGREALLEALAGSIQFRVSGPGIHHLTLQRQGEQVRVGSEPLPDAALEISGPPLAFAALAAGDESVFSQGQVTVTGDMATAHQFQRALARLRPDWEAALARRIGDVPAHFIGQRVREAVNWTRRASASLGADLEEYIHEESTHLPGRRELEATFSDIDQLSLRTERLEARVQRLQDQANPTDKRPPDPEPS